MKQLIWITIRAIGRLGMWGQLPLIFQPHPLKLPWLPCLQPAKEKCVQGKEEEESRILPGPDFGADQSARGGERREAFIWLLGHCRKRTWRRPRVSSGCQPKHMGLSGKVKWVFRGRVGRDQDGRGLGLSGGQEEGHQARSAQYSHIYNFLQEIDMIYQSDENLGLVSYSSNLKKTKKKPNCKAPPCRSGHQCFL